MKRQLRVLWRTLTAGFGPRFPQLREPRAHDQGQTLVIRGPQGVTAECQARFRSPGGASTASTRGLLLCEDLFRATDDGESADPRTSCGMATVKSSVKSAEPGLAEARCQ